MPRKGLGKGLDSLIPDYYDEDFDSNSTQSLEDLLNESEEKVENEDSADEKRNIFEKLEEENDKENNHSTDSDSEEVSEVFNSGATTPRDWKQLFREILGREEKAPAIRQY